MLRRLSILVMRSMLGLALGACVLPAGAIAAVGGGSSAGPRADATAARAPLTATGVRLGDHPAFVRADVDFTGGTIRDADVEAIKPGVGMWASLRVSRPGIVTHAAPKSGFGATVRIVQGQGQLRIDMSAKPLRFKYVSYEIVGGTRLSVDMWKSAPPWHGAVIRHAPGGCLTLDQMSVRIDGRVTAAGTESVFEHNVVVVVRGANGRVMARQAVTGHSGHWSATLYVSSPMDQEGTLEAIEPSAKDGSLACIVQDRVMLPFTTPAPQKLVYRAVADVDGDGRTDLVSLRRTSRTTGAIDVTLASGRHLSVTTHSVAAALPALVRVGDVNGRAGAELFVAVEHVSTSDSIGIYTYAGGALRLAGTFPSSAHPGLFAGMTCPTSVQPFVTVHEFVLQPQTGSPSYWTRADTVYAWHGSSLVVDRASSPVQIGGTPPPELVGVQCGHRPEAAPTVSPGGVIRPWRWGVNYLGSWHIGAPGNGTYPAASWFLGQPSSVRRIGLGTCIASWQRLGLTIRFTTFGKATGCRSLFAQQGTVKGDAGRHTWRTTKGLRVGDSLAKLDRLYPTAIHGKSTRVIAYETHSPYGGGRLDLITARITCGRVSSFDLFIGAAGD